MILTPCPYDPMVGSRHVEFGQPKSTLTPIAAKRMKLVLFNHYTGLSPLPEEDLTVLYGTAKIRALWQVNHSLSINMGQHLDSRCVLLSRMLVRDRARVLVV